MSTYNSRMAAKLGLKSPDTALVNQLLTLMARSGADWTNMFRYGHEQGVYAVEPDLWYVSLCCGVLLSFALYHITSMQQLDQILAVKLWY